MSGQYTCRWFRESDLGAYMHGLYEELYDEYDEAIFRWKMVDTPWSLGFVSIAVVEYEGVPVAFNSFLPLRVRHGCDVFPIVQGCDGFVEIPHRGKGLFQLTLKFMLDELRGRGPEMLMGFNFAGSAGAAQKVGSTLTGDVHALCAKATHLTTQRVKGEEDVEVTPCGLTDIHAIYERWAAETGKLHYHRTREYLRWRYGRPGRRPSFYRVRDGADEGYATVDLGPSLNSLFVEDYIHPMEKPAVLSALIKHVLGTGISPDEVYITEAVGSPMYTSAVGLGFQPDHYYTLIMKGISGIEERGKNLYRRGVELTDISGWHITASDVF